MGVLSSVVFCLRFSNSVALRFHALRALQFPPRPPRSPRLPLPASTPYCCSLMRCPLTLTKWYTTIKAMAATPRPFERLVSVPSDIIWGQESALPHRTYWAGWNEDDAKKQDGDGRCV